MTSCGACVPDVAAAAHDFAMFGVYVFLGAIALSVPGLFVVKRLLGDSTAYLGLVEKTALTTTMPYAPENDGLDKP